MEEMKRRRGTLELGIKDMVRSGMQENGGCCSGKEGFECARLTESRVIG